MRLSLVEDLKPKALELVRNSPISICIGDVARSLDISWATARQVMMELVLEGKIECEKTTKSRIFRVQNRRKVEQ